MYVIIIAFWSESTLYSCLNVKELLVQSRREIWSFNDSNGIRTYCCDNNVLRIWNLKELLKGFLNSLKIPVNVEFIINRVAFLPSITLLKNKFLRRYFFEEFVKNLRKLFHRTLTGAAPALSPSSCYSMKSVKQELILWINSILNY